jgi:hypothetical protein
MTVPGQVIWRSIASVSAGPGLGCIHSSGTGGGRQSEIRSGWRAT